MAKFDPKASMSEGSGDEVASFEGMIALVWFERKKAKSDMWYLRGKFEVCAGPQAGRTFFANTSLDVSVNAGRLGVWCAAVGCEEAFDLDDVQEIKRVFGRKPFKAQVEREQNGKYVNHDIKRYTVQAKLTAEERKQAEGWLLDQEEKRALGANALDELDKAASGGGGKGGSGKPDFGDDDIPF